MTLTAELLVLDSQDQPAASCAVCANDIPAGEGITASYFGRILRFKCPGCFSRFQADPDRFLTGPAASCCGAHDYSPASEWT